MRSRRSSKAITPEVAAQKAHKIGKGVGLCVDPNRKVFLIFTNTVFPIDWLQVAFKLDGKRYDFGQGEKSRTVFMFPFGKKDSVVSSLKILMTAELPRARIRGQVDAPKPVIRVEDSFYRPLIAASV